MRRLIAFAFLWLPALAQADADAARAAMQAGNYAEAYCLWRTLADGGDPDAQYNLGWMYHNGYGLAIDDRAALRWWDSAAERGSTDALYAIGNLHRFGGRGVRKDPPRAIDYYVRAAERGDDESALLLRTLIARNDASVGRRRAELVRDHAAALGGALVVRKDGTGFRKAAAVEAAVLAVFGQGKRLVELSRRKNGWVQAGDPDDGRIGWVKATLVAPAP